LPIYNSRSRMACIACACVACACVPVLRTTKHGQRLLRRAILRLEEVVLSVARRLRGGRKMNGRVVVSRGAGVGMARRGSGRERRGRGREGNWLLRSIDIYRRIGRCIAVGEVIVHVIICVRRIRTSRIRIRTRTRSGKGRVEISRNVDVIVGSAGVIGGGTKSSVEMSRRVRGVRSVRIRRWSENRLSCLRLVVGGSESWRQLVVSGGIEIKRT
jgi:hypothetical protein